MWPAAKIALSAALLVLPPKSASAATVTLNYFGTNFGSGIPGHVSLDDTLTATITLDEATGLFSIDTAIGTISESVSYLGGSTSTSGTGTPALIQFQPPGDFTFGDQVVASFGVPTCTTTTDLVSLSSNTTCGSTFTEVSGTFTDPPAADPLATPLPGALPLMLTGFGGLGLLGWRTKRKAQANKRLATVI
jgi:hypothetical protein